MIGGGMERKFMRFMRLLVLAAIIAIGTAFTVSAQPVDSLWQPLAVVDVTALTGDYQIRAAACVEKDGIGPYIYVAGGRNYSSITDNVVYRFNLDWTLNATYPQPTGSGFGYCDLAWDGNYLYGLTSYYIFAFDLNGNLVPSYNIPLPALITVDRGLAYDPATDHFWIGNGGEPGLVEVNRAGAVVSSGYFIDGVLAWDNYDPPGPWLWIVYSSGLNTIKKYNPWTHSLVSTQIFSLPGYSFSYNRGWEFTTSYNVIRPGHVKMIGVADGGLSNSDLVYVLDMYSGFDPDVPAAPYFFTVTTNSATLQASLSWTNPRLTAGGDTMTAINSIVVERNNSIIATLSGAPGQPMTYSDVLPVSGFYTYEVYCWNDSGAGLHAERSPWIGLDIPAAPSNVLAVPNNLTARLTWTAPTAGAHGGYWPPGSWDGQKIYRDGALLNVLTGTNVTYTDTVAEPGTYTYGVAYFNAAGDGPVCNAPPIGLEIFQSGIIANGGFETGSIEPWYEPQVPPYWGVTGTGVHSGNYCAYNGNAYNPTPLRQNFSPVPVSSITSVTFWLKQDSDFGAAWVTFYYSDGSYNAHEYSGVHSWAQYNATSYLQHGKNLTCIQLQFGFSDDWEGWIDDVSILVDTTALAATISIDPVNPPIMVPPGGGFFDFNVTAMNSGAVPRVMDIWTMCQTPNTYWVGPIFYAYGLTLPAGVSVTRTRTQLVPSFAPSGTYTYEARIGYYPNVIAASDNFTFVKQPGGMTADEYLQAGEWLNTGEDFSLASPVGGGETPSLSTDFGVTVSPNPFNASTVACYKLQIAGHVSLKVYDTAGRLVATLEEGWREAGEHKATFEGSEIPSGVYIYRLQAGENTATGKMVLLK
jgi:hypothetical protein